MIFCTKVLVTLPIVRMHCTARAARTSTFDFKSLNNYYLRDLFSLPFALPSFGFIVDISKQEVDSNRKCEDVQFSLNNVKK